ncbi:ABC1 kinase family protein [Bacillus sp. B-jedd]|uniref:ABC1 kinase family protein n=1 Tax=Bacillus sp. B-jedd TaxID=1476857 RepID=UPI0005156960|nr:AarF/ABC1/UbiB kinase family protein [Bacillus sp. B-jedd]CEG28342.1 ABC1 family protein [Bacillus sp. B-jedd]
MLTDKLRRLNRYKEIISLLGKYGFGYLVEEVGLTQLLSFKDRIKADFEKENSQEIGVRLRGLLEELGPTFIKLGQLLSIRSDFLPDDIIKELETLQDNVPPVPLEEIQGKITQELGKPPKEIFHSFNEEYIAAASIGQVYEAVLWTGEKVMVKVQRPGIRKTIYTDLDILMDLARLLEQNYDWAEQHKVTEITEELGNSIRKELDYLEEARNTETIAMQFEEDERIKVPDIFWDYTTSTVLTMEKINGIKISEVRTQVADKEKKREIADLLVQSFVTQILRQGFFHGDPHPGNILYIPETGQLAFIDFGQIGRMSSRMRYDTASMMIGLIREDTDMIIKALYRLSDVPSDVNEKQFYDDVDRISKMVSRVPFGELDLGKTVQDLLSTAQEHRIIVPTELTMLGKSLMTVEGIISGIDPELNLLQLAKPYAEELIIERYDPVNIGKRLFKDAEDIGETMVKLPERIDEVLGQAAEGDLKLKISLSQIDSIFNKIDRISNQVSFSLTLLAFSIVVLGLIVGATFGTDTFLTSIHALEIGFTVAFLMFLWIIYSIIRSGRF